MKVSIIIPAFNEERTIRELLERVQAVALPGIHKEIIVVDDASTDATPEILKTIPDISHIRHVGNRGKGASLTTGCKAATGEIVLFQDADLEYTPDDYPVVLQPLLEGRCDAVMGSRFLKHKPVFWGKHRAPYFTHYLGNKLIIWITNRLYGQCFTDYEGCYKAFTRQCLAATPIMATGFEFDNELICKLLRKGVRIVEVPIRYRPRSYEAGKKITWKHGLVMLWTIIKWRFAEMPSVDGGSNRAGTRQT